MTFRSSVIQGRNPLAQYLSVGSYHFVFSVDFSNINTSWTSIRTVLEQRIVTGAMASRAFTIVVGRCCNYDDRHIEDSVVVRSDLLLLRRMALAAGEDVENLHGSSVFSIAVAGGVCVLQSSNKRTFEFMTSS
jgi:hypothetical protein